MFDRSAEAETVSWHSYIWCSKQTVLQPARQFALCAAQVDRRGDPNRLGFVVTLCYLRAGGWSR